MSLCHHPSAHAKDIDEEAEERRLETFLKLEAGTLTIAAFFLAIAIFVATRPFMPAGAFRKIVTPTVIILAGFVLLHFKITTGRMNDVKTTFEAGRDVICENRSSRSGARSIVINRSLGWKLDGDVFVNPEFERPFHTARCIKQ